MAYKDILVYLDSHHGYPACLRLAVSIARQNKARLVALSRFEPPQTTAPRLVIDVAGGAYAVSDEEQARYERERDDAVAIEEQIKASFFAEIKEAGLIGIWQLVPDKPKEIIAAVTEQARHADLVVLGQAAPDHPLFDTLATLPEKVMMESGRPVVIVPHTKGLETVGENVLVAWKETREAARAVADALPLLQSAETVTVLTIGRKAEPEGEHNPELRNLTDHLAQHDIRVDVVHIDSADVYAARLILARAASLGCDLIVMGGYGHSRTRELILGGATHAVLQHMTIPVLMSH